MEDVTVSVRVGEDVHTQMKKHDEINWSAVIRNAVAEKLESMHEIDLERAKKAVKTMDDIRKSKVFDKGRSSTEIIREWREKRR